MATWSQHFWLDTNEVKIGAVASFVAGGVAAVILYRWLTKPRNLPPGPCGLPIVGAIPFLSANLHEDFIRFSKKYKSDVVSFYTGSTLTVALNSEKAIREAFSEVEFSGRPTDLAAVFQATDMLSSAPYSESWKNNKKFMMQSLRSFGFIGPSAEKLKTDQIKGLEAEIDARADKPWTKNELDEHLSKVTSNVIVEMLFGCQYELNDPDLADLIDAVREIQSFFVESAEVLALFLTVFPSWFAKLVFFRTVKKARRNTQRLFEIVARHLVEHRAKLKEGTEPKDFLDAALQEFKKQPHITDEHIIDTIVLFLPDAIEGIAAQIQWCIYFLASFPAHQSRMVDEIKSACGPRPATIQDKAILPFCECVIMEAMRLSSLYSVSAPHVTTTDATIEGYTVPAGSTVFANIYAVQHDPDTFSLPEEFSPDRFLEESGSIVTSKSFIPFGIGRRMCIGESLVRSELFLAVTRLVFRYHISFKNTAPPLDGVKGIFRRVPDYELVFTKRM